MAALVFAIISGPARGWTSARVLVSAAVAAVALTLFARWESRIPYPMLDLAFFRDRRFTGAVGGVVLVTFGMGGALFLLTQHLQSVLGYGPLEAGLRTAPLALTVVVLNFSGLAAKATARLGTPLSVLGGMVLMAGGLVSIASGGEGYGGVAAGLVLIGVGCAVANPAMAHAIMSAIPPEKAGVGAGVNGTLAEFGNGLGVAVLGAVLSASLTAGKPLADGLGAGLLVGAVAVLGGGLVAAVLLRRADKAKADKEKADREKPDKGTAGVLV